MALAALFGSKVTRVCRNRLPKQPRHRKISRVQAKAVTAMKVRNDLLRIQRRSESRFPVPLQHTDQRVAVCYPRVRPASMPPKAAEIVMMKNIGISAPRTPLINSCGL